MNGDLMKSSGYMMGQKNGNAPAFLGLMIVPSMIPFIRIKTPKKESQMTYYPG